MPENHAVNRWQEVLYALCFGPGAVVEPKRIAYRLHKASNYLSDICRRDRVDPLAVFNEILREAEPLAKTDPQRFLAVATPIFQLLTEGTRWFPAYVDAQVAERMPFDRLCAQTGTLLKDLGGALDSLAAVEKDGRYDSEDDPSINEFIHHSAQLIHRLQMLSAELNRRRHQEAHPR